LEEICKESSQFKDSQEYSFIKSTFELIKSQNLTSFKKIIADFEKQNTIEQWKIVLFNKISENNFKN